MSAKQRIVVPSELLAAHLAMPRLRAPRTASAIQARQHEDRPQRLPLHHRPGLSLSLSLSHYSVSAGGAARPQVLPGTPPVPVATCPRGISHYHAFSVHSLLLRLSESPLRYEYMMIQVCIRLTLRDSSCDSGSNGDGGRREDAGTSILLSSFVGASAASCHCSSSESLASP